MKEICLEVKWYRDRLVTVKTKKSKAIQAQTNYSYLGIVLLIWNLFYTHNKILMLKSAKSIIIRLNTYEFLVWNYFFNIHLL